MVLALAYFVIRGSLRDAILSSRQRGRLGALAAKLVAGLLLRAGVVFLIIGAGRLPPAEKALQQGPMMSKEEVKQEHKQEEGDPHIKGMRRHLQEEMAMSGATVNVPKANVVVVNPTHLAIALRYDDESMGAPEVIAKGREELAAKIRELAETHRIPILRNVPLAHSLYAVELGKEIPEDLDEAVAEVLNWVFQLKRDTEEQV